MFNLKTIAAIVFGLMLCGSLYIFSTYWFEPVYSDSEIATPLYDVNDTKY